MVRHATPGEEDDFLFCKVTPKTPSLGLLPLVLVLKWKVLRVLSSESETVALFRWNVNKRNIK